MDKMILIEYCGMKAEIKQLRDLIDKTEKILEKIEGEERVSKGIEYSRVKDLLLSRKARLRRREEKLLELTNSVEKFIESIEKDEIRTMFRFYYIEGLTWQQVAMEMNELFPKRKIAYTEDSCQKKNARFLKNKRKNVR